MLTTDACKAMVAALSSAGRQGMTSRWSESASCRLGWRVDEGCRAMAVTSWLLVRVRKACRTGRAAEFLRTDS